MNPAAPGGPARLGVFEAVTTSGLEHAGRAAIAMCPRIEARRPVPGSMPAQPPASWRGRGPVVLVGGFAATGPVLTPMIS
jgi:hypothetical protein